MRSHQYQQGRRNGVKACVEWLHEEAGKMNDPHARALLNTAAWHMGVQFKSSEAPPLIPSAEGASTTLAPRDTALLQTQDEAK